MSPGVEGVIGLLGAHPYLLLFPLVLLEGPVATVCAGFIVSAGLMDWPFALVLVVGADLLADSIYYALGRFGNRPVTSRLLDRLGLSTERLSRLRAVLHRHGPRVIVWAKVADLFAVPVFVASGLVRMRYRSFIVRDFVVTLLKSAALMALGFYFGARVEPYLDFGPAVAALISLTVIAVLAVTVLKRKILEEDEVEGLDR